MVTLVMCLRAVKLYLVMSRCTGVMVPVRQVSAADGRADDDDDVMMPPVLKFIHNKFLLKANILCLNFTSGICTSKYRCGLPCESWDNFSKNQINAVKCKQKVS